jgi:hypothetical protein
MASADRVERAAVRSKPNSSPSVSRASTTPSETTSNEGEAQPGSSPTCQRQRFLVDGDHGLRGRGPETTRSATKTSNEASLGMRTPTVASVGVSTEYHLARRSTETSNWILCRSREFPEHREVDQE